MLSVANVLYDEQIVEHSKKPRNHRRMESSNRIAEGHNPLCGDHQIVYLLIENDVIQDISFLCIGADADAAKNCAISTASASMMTKALKGKTVAEADTLFNEFHGMLTGSLDEESTPNGLGHLKVFSGVREFPVRVKCATLPWHTLRAAINNRDRISTE